MNAPNISTNKVAELQLSRHDAIVLWDLLDRHAAKRQTLRWIRDRLARTYVATFDHEIEQGAKTGGLR